MLTKLGYYKLLLIVILMCFWTLYDSTVMNFNITLKQSEKFQGNKAIFVIIKEGIESKTVTSESGNTVCVKVGDIQATVLCTYDSNVPFSA
jgi:cell division protein YceG involved in septum cleavage